MMQSVFSLFRFALSLSGGLHLPAVPDSRSLIAGEATDDWAGASQALAAPGILPPSTYSRRLLLLRYPQAGGIAARAQGASSWRRREHVGCGTMMPSFAAALAPCASLRRRTCAPHAQPILATPTSPVAFFSFMYSPFMTAVSRCFAADGPGASKCRCCAMRCSYRRESQRVPLLAASSSC